MQKFDTFSVDKPYPELTVYENNPHDVFALMPDYGGRESETTAIMQYSYQHYILKEHYPEVAYNLENIAISEMRHHELLANAIVQSGGDPIIAGNHCFWSGSSVNYVCDVCDILKANIAAEKGAIVNYKRTITKLCNKSIIALIRRIIEDEELHIRLFTQMLDELECK